MFELQLRTAKPGPKKGKITKLNVTGLTPDFLNSAWSESYYHFND